jgi:hypothetical protein
MLQMNDASCTLGPALRLRRRPQGQSPQPSSNGLSQWRPSLTRDASIHRKVETTTRPVGRAACRIEARVAPTYRTMAFWAIHTFGSGRPDAVCNLPEIIGRMPDVSAAEQGREEQWRRSS